MLFKIFLYIIGIFLMTIGFSTLILYINLFSFGYNFKEYVSFIIKLPQFYYFILGFVVINLAYFVKGGKNDKYI